MTNDANPGEKPLPAKKAFWLALGGTFLFVCAYSLSNNQYSMAFREFLQNPGSLPAFFASDYFSGLEYGYIGNHLASGHGFVGPFSDLKAPTATMPPVLPLVYAGIFYLLGFKTVWSFWAIFVLRIFAVGGGFFLLFRLSLHARAQGLISWRNGLLHVAVVFSLLFAMGNLFFFYYDEWFLWFVASLALFFAQKLLSHTRRPALHASLFGIFIGGVTLTQTVAGAALLAAIALTGLKLRRYTLLLAIPAAIAVTAPWIFRNYLIFHEFMPVKSNLGFELYFSTVHESKGILILEEQNQSKKHPIKEGPEKEFALKLGEQEYQRRKTAEFLEILRNEPMRYIKKIGYRMLYSTVVFPYSSEEQKVQAPAWPFLKYLVYPAVFVFWFLQWFMPGRHDPFILFCLLLYACYLTPYILINFWLKYWVHMLPLYAVIVAYSSAEFYRRHMREE